MKTFLSTLVAAAAIAVTSAGGAMAQASVSQAELINNLQGLGARSTILNVDQLRQDVTVKISQEASEDVVNRNQYLDYFANLPNFSVEILFDFDSAIIKPDSYEILGAMADALHNPVLLRDQFLIVGHTDAKGKREYNLELSQRRADSIRNALTTVFKVDPARIQAFGLGEEQLRDPNNPDAAVNRRVQLLNLGPMP